MSPDYPPVTVEKLRDHFRTAYKLNEEQVELMIVSSARSLRSTFLALEEIRSERDLVAKLPAIAHGLKGLLANMGQHEWALLAAEAENAVRSGRAFDLAGFVLHLRQAMPDINKILSSC